MSQTLPYSSWCFVCGKDNPCGLRLKFHREGQSVAAEFTPHERYNGFPGMTHGGIVTALLDEAMGWATAFDSRRFSHTAELKIRFRRPTPAGAALRVEARATGSRGRLAFAVGEIRDSAGEVLVEAEGKFMLLGEKETRQVDDMLIYDPDSWRIFDPDQA